MGSKMNFSDSNFINGGNQEVSPSSVYAFKIALMTMKERCQKLQNRLSAMEEENLQLRIERHSIPGIYKKETEINPELSVLNRKVEELLRQKSKLSHHIYMVATENKDLWEKLYKLSDEKYCAENNLQLQPDSKHKYSNLKPLRSLHIAEICKDGKEESLEEISLRGINASADKKPENQISTLKSDSLKVKGCEFTLSNTSEDEEMECEDFALTEMNEILEKLKVEKQVLRQHQEELRNAFQVIAEFTKENIPCKVCTQREKEDSVKKTVKESVELHMQESENDEKNKSEGEVLNICNGISLQSKENDFEDRICPLCITFFAKSTPFDEFNDHVLSHFVEEPEEVAQLGLYEVED